MWNVVASRFNPRYSHGLPVVGNDDEVSLVFLDITDLYEEEAVYAFINTVKQAKRDGIAGTPDDVIGALAITEDVDRNSHARSELIGMLVNADHEADFEQIIRDRFMDAYNLTYDLMREDVRSR